MDSISRTGVDLLVSDRRNRRLVSIQVKFSKDFLPSMTDRGLRLQQQLRACGWWTIDRRKLVASPADFWVFVLLGFARGTTDFVIIPTTELARRLRTIHGPPKRIQSYIWVTEHGKCWETRGLHRSDEVKIGDGDFRDPRREFTRWLNNWSPIAKLNR